MFEMNGTIDLERLAAEGQAWLRSALERMVSVEFLIELLALIITGVLAQLIAPRLDHRRWAIGRGPVSRTLKRP
jgi:hypothetical protein